MKRFGLHEVTAHLDIDSWNAPEAFRGRQKLLLSDAQEGLNDVRDDIEARKKSFKTELLNRNPRAARQTWVRRAGVSK